MISVLPQLLLDNFIDFSRNKSLLNNSFLDSEGKNMDSRWFTICWFLDHVWNNSGLFWFYSGLFLAYVPYPENSKILKVTILVYQINGE